MSSLTKRPGSAKIVSVYHYKDDNKADIAEMVLEINIHSDINISSSFAMLTIADYSNYMGNFGIANGHTIEMEIQYSDRSIKRRYTIQSVKFVNNLENGRTYELMCVSPLRYISNFAKVSKAYLATTSDMAADIFNNHTDEKVFHWEPSVSVQQLIIPNMNPIDAIQWLALRSQSESSVAPFRFFQDSQQRFSFMSLPRARQIWGNDTLTYKYNADTNMINGVPNPQAELTRILNLKYTNSFDIKEAIEEGNISETFFYTDLTLKTFNVFQNNYWDTYSKDALNNKTLFREEDMAPGKITSEFRTSYNTYLESTNNPTNPGSKNEKDYYHQKIEIIVEGNPLVEISQILNIEIPSPEPVNAKEKFKLDPYWSGKYIVLAKRDRINIDGHKMVLLLGKDSIK